MLINLKVKTLDAQTHELCIDNELTVREFKDKVAEKTNIAADQQRIIYCGRVMVDDKQLKEYDVDGKVLHVAERPPPSQRLPNDRRTRNRPSAGGMRNSPLYRALDGMVVGTMAFPMNANTNGQAPVNPFAASSSFCMNRITVARHMLECANNIAAYLEDPSRGLNNQSLDILARGRWTMESTVVEVGITSDIPQSQQIVEMVQGAVQAALRRSGNTNVTLVQLPTVYSPDTNNSTAGAGAAAAAVIDDDTDVTPAQGENTSATSVTIEDVIDDDENTPTNEQQSDNSTTTTGNANATATTSNENTENATAGANENGTDNSRRRTGSPVLASVIEQMRSVQNRLNPFIDQYYDLLLNEPTFDDAADRGNAQRLFDRVSEAFHYLSHAQHAISDLMLDVSQDTPRYLTCRPILVEQSGYFSSNNFLTQAMIPSALNQQQPRNTTNANATNNAAASNILTQLVVAAANNAGNAAANTTPATTTNSGNTNVATPRTAARNETTSGPSPSSNDTANSTVDDPIDEPAIWHPPINFTAPSNDTTNRNSSNNNAASGRVPVQRGGTLEIILQPSRAIYLERNLQRQVARLLQDVVSAAPFDTEFHVHINTPTVVSIDVPIGVSGSSVGGGVVGNNGNNGSGTQASQTTNTTLNNNDNNTATTTIRTTTSTATSTTTTNDNPNTNTTTNSSSSTANPARVTTATLPTTSTQTRSTSRPQVHIGNIPVMGMPTGWHTQNRVLPNNYVSSFDRFLPCNSHHIREPSTTNNATNNSSSNSTISGSNDATNDNASNATTNDNSSNYTTASEIPQQSTNSGVTPAAVNDVLQRMRPPSYRQAQTTPSSDANTINEASQSGSIQTLNSMQEAEVNLSGMHSQFIGCLTDFLFEGEPINEITKPEAINRAIQWFSKFLIYLPQYEKPEYDSRNSLLNILRSTLTAAFEVLLQNPIKLEEFEWKFKQICEQFCLRLSSVLHICIGRGNLEIFWGQLMRSLRDSMPTDKYVSAVAFLRSYLNPTIPSVIDEDDAEQFIVRRDTQAASNGNNLQLPMDTDVEMSVAATTSQPIVRLALPTSILDDLLHHAGGAVPYSAAPPGANLMKHIHTQSVGCLREFLFESKNVNEINEPAAINRAIQWFDKSLLYLPQYEKPEYDSKNSLLNILRSTLPTAIAVIAHNPINLEEFELKFKQICEQFRSRLYNVLYICIGRSNAELFWVQLMRLLCNSMPTNKYVDAIEFLKSYLSPTIPGVTNEDDAQQFIVRRNTRTATNDNNVEMPLCTDVEMSSVATTSQPDVSDEPLPSIVPGSEAWHRHFPNDWLPIIARDIQRQTDNPPNKPPFSDAYISGMSSKRRKLVQNTKTPADIGALIADSVRKAIHNPGVGTSTASNPAHKPEDIAQSIASDATVQSSCIDAIRTNIRERLKKDPDFEPEKFPHSNKFIKK